MSIRTAAQAVASAKAKKTNVPDTCQAIVRGYYGAPSAGDVDHDGDADAIDGWLSEPAAKRHTDRHPAVGAPVAYKHGSGHGHRAIYIGDGKIRTSDYTRGHMGTVPLDWPETEWGMTYEGWSETIDGHDIPGLGERDTLPAAPKGGTATKLDPAVKPGVTHPQVRDVQAVLVKLGFKIPHAPTEHYGSETKAAVAAWYDAHPDCRTEPKGRDYAIGPKAWAEMQREAGRK